MATQKKETKSRKRKVFTSGMFHAAPVTVGKKFITIKLPRRVAEYFDLDKHEIFWSPINGVIQLSGNQPHMVIPMMSVNTNQFIAQKS